MATNHKKVLGQAAPAAATPGTLYTCGASKQAVFSNINCCNYGGAASIDTVRIKVANEADANKQFIVHQLQVLAHDTRSLQLGITVTATDVVTVLSDTGTVAFQGFGYEEDI